MGVPPIVTAVVDEGVPLTVAAVVDEGVPLLVAVVVDEEVPLLVAVVVDEEVPLLVAVVVDKGFRFRRPAYPSIVTALASAACTVPGSGTPPVAESPLQPLSRPVTVRLTMQRVEAGRNLFFATARAPVR
jgi:hypothetical protein